MKQIMVEKAVRIPDTDIILEKGDRLFVRPKNWKKMQENFSIPDIMDVLTTVTALARPFVDKVVDADKLTKTAFSIYDYPFLIGLTNKITKIAPIVKQWAKASEHDDLGDIGRGYFKKIEKDYADIIEKAEEYGYQETLSNA